jgi:hypothetical protein
MGETTELCAENPVIPPSLSSTLWSLMKGKITRQLGPLNTTCVMLQLKKEALLQSNKESILWRKI